MNTDTPSAHTMIIRNHSTGCNAKASRCHARSNPIDTASPGPDCDPRQKARRSTIGILFYSFYPDVTRAIGNSICISVRDPVINIGGSKLERFVYRAC